MELYVIRHADAVNLGEQNISEDADRPLSARGQAQYDADKDTYSTTGPTGSTPAERMKAAGYTLGASDPSGENVDLEFSFQTTDTLTSLARQAYEDEFKNFGLATSTNGGRFGFVQNRDNILDDSFREIGAGVAIGTSTSTSRHRLGRAVAGSEFSRGGAGGGGHRRLASR